MLEPKPKPMLEPSLTAQAKAQSHDARTYSAQNDGAKAEHLPVHPATSSLATNSPDTSGPDTSGPTTSGESAEQAVYLGLVNPKTPINVGGIMRASGCYGVDGVFYTGKRYELAARSGPLQYNADTKGAAARIPLTGVSSLLDAIPADTQLICVDLVVGATPLPDFVHPAKAFYVFGPEDGTISQGLIDNADAVV
ncbi:MAG: TrmH family RNA methyltransferase, partial [Shewanella sp.]